MRVCCFTSLFILFVAACVGQTTPDKPTPGFSLGTIDKSIDPCVDFYQYACGKWFKNEIPPDQGRWGSFVELAERNLDTMRVLLEKAAAGGPNRNPIDQKIGDFYASCMDEKAVNARGIAPLLPDLDRISSAHDKDALIGVIARIHLDGSRPLFSFSSNSDFHNAGQVIAYIDQGGLTLPDRSYYINDDDAKMKEMRQKLLDYSTQVFTLAGRTPQQAAEAAQTVLRIETELAQAQMDRTERRDPKKRDHKMSRTDAVALAPNFYFDHFFNAIGAPRFTELNVSNPDFFKKVNATLDAESLDALKTYVTWHVLNSEAPWLTQPYVDANFKFRQALTGQKEIQARWKRCVSLTDSRLGEALGQRYVEATFGPDGKARMLKMVDLLEQSLAADIHDLDWMSDDTKKQAKVKLDAIRNKIGYPDAWRDYSTVAIQRGDLFGNIRRSTEFATRREIAKIDKPLDRVEWTMTPPTVNAYYSGSFNEIVFPAGILQPPFFDKTMDDGVNFGGIGLVIGHELTHGFDDQGRKYDADGNLQDWWTEQDGKEFEKRASCVADEYSNFIAVDDRKLNGKLTLGENTADNGGARIALAALERLIAEDKSGKSAQKIDGYTPEQRFFLGFGRVWCEKVRPEQSRVWAVTDPHSPGKYRVDGVVQNMPEFQKAWGCKAGQPMVAENACHVW
jgi:putative endopeptidase